jgi:hypothetical protein
MIIEDPRIEETKGHRMSKPDPAARITAGLIVGVVSTTLFSVFFGRKAGVLGGLALLGVHELVDAPVADFLSREYGI